MDPVFAAFLFVALFLGVLVFRLSMGMSWPWGLALLLALIPPVATFFLGIIGLLGSALYVGAMYKAAGSS